MVQGRCGERSAHAADLEPQAERMQDAREGGDGPERDIDPDLYEDAERTIAEIKSATHAQSSGAASSASAITASDVRPLLERPSGSGAVDEDSAEAVAQRTSAVVQLLTHLAYHLFTIRSGRTEIQRQDIEGALQIIAHRANRGSTSTAQVTDPNDTEAGDVFATGGSESNER